MATYIPIVKIHFLLLPRFLPTLPTFSKFNFTERKSWLQRCIQNPLKRLRWNKIVKCWILIKSLRNSRKISLLKLSEFKAVNFFFPWNHQKINGLLIASGGLLIVSGEIEDDPKSFHKKLYPVESLLLSHFIAPRVLGRDFQNIFYGTVKWGKKMTT